jgi:hypothetical protein
VRERFGVDALRVQLSKQLVSLTQRELPKMKEALDEVLAQVGGLTTLLQAFVLQQQVVVCVTTVALHCHHVRPHVPCSCKRCHMFQQTAQMQRSRLAQACGDVHYLTSVLIRCHGM